VPPELDSASPDAEAMATAMVRYWTPGEVTETLQPLLVKLLRLGLRYPPGEELEEEVSDAVYVMF
jgi:hypothetical protein